MLKNEAISIRDMNEDQVLFVTENMQTGQYICSLLVNGKQINSLVFSVIQ